MPNPLADAIAHAPTEPREELIAHCLRLAEQAGWATALRALFRQQVNSGYVLFDPAGAEEREIADPGRRLRLRLQWNPLRELRRRHDLLVARGIIATPAKPERLAHRDERGVGCYLCPANIALQNPGEVLLPLRLAGEDYALGANFAPITAHHFTVMSATHTAQTYDGGVTRAGLALCRLTGGEFRVLYNGRAGASILRHQHLHATDARFPVEALADTAAPTGAVRPLDYYLPLYLASGPDDDAVAAQVDTLVARWEALSPERHTVNLLLRRHGGLAQAFVFLRDRERLAGPGRGEALGSFELAGRLVVSATHERALFDQADLASLTHMLESAAPERRLPFPSSATT